MAATTKTEAINDINTEFSEEGIYYTFESLGTEFWMELLAEVDERGRCWTKFDYEMSFSATKIQKALGI